MFLFDNFFSSLAVRAISTQKDDEGRFYPFEIMFGIPPIVIEIESGVLIGTENKTMYVAVSLAARYQYKGFSGGPARCFKRYNQSA